MQLTYVKVSMYVYNMILMIKLAIKGCHFIVTSNHSI